MTQSKALLLGVGISAATTPQTGKKQTRQFWTELIKPFDTAFAFLTLEDEFAHKEGDGLDAILLANWLAPRLTNIGIIAGASLNFLEPFHVSTAIATLDYVSEGRAGLLAQQLTDQRNLEARKALGSLNGYPSLDQQSLKTDTEDAIEVIRRLWDSWEDDAVIRDQQTQRFLDASKLHYINFESDNFRILGPSITPRPPQGQPVVAATLSNLDELNITRGADVIFVPADEQLISVANAAPFVVADLVVSDKPTVQDTIDAATEIQAWGASGIRLVLSDPQLQSDFVLKELLPALQAQKLVHIGEGTTLRSRFGLPDAINRYSTAA
ncbi:LLM class flavin-dependent oxidoreductase [Ochrobactrum sp. Marseille-Q0166]|uniref:LLM class flavin-dependent oxidoreductase n=1 Tax=Ochrobactrum sp. Marseille-Q0166 TaxID=2761105 RepID=UPI001655C502|nr:LLM class flavin-dependent oxidoreductase [Ochrobactrum sp. Marseille-Q0166]MBC8719130.1 LLM class flavin-dependent oxidoreductase [Ochrobactrum sp. Marseille-Q0166]